MALLPVPCCAQCFAVKAGGPPQKSDGTAAKTTQKLQACGTCHLERYCNRECQRRHWGEHASGCAASAKVITPSGVDRIVQEFCSARSGKTKLHLDGKKRVLSKTSPEEGNGKTMSVEVKIEGQTGSSTYLLCEAEEEQPSPQETEKDSMALAKKMVEQRRFTEAFDILFRIETQEDPFNKHFLAERMDRVIRAAFNLGMALEEVREQTIRIQEREEFQHNEVVSPVPLPTCTWCSAVEGKSWKQSDGSAVNTAQKLDVCARCYLARYCSEACQKAHWKSGHKAECREHARDIAPKAVDRIVQKFCAAQPGVMRLHLDAEHKVVSMSSTHETKETLSVTVKVGEQEERCYTYRLCMPTKPTKTQAKKDMEASLPTVEEVEAMNVALELIGAGRFSPAFELVSRQITHPGFLVCALTALVDKMVSERKCSIDETMQQLKVLNLSKECLNGIISTLITEEKLPLAMAVQNLRDAAKVNQSPRPN